MTPGVDPAVSARMRRVRRTGTAPELALAEALRSRRCPRYSVDMASLPGRPDLVFRRDRVAVFVHGCFWHGCRTHHREPRTRRAWWRAKIDRNRARDVRARRALRAMGWTVFTVWEHEPPRRAAERIVAKLSGRAVRRR